MSIRPNGPAEKGNAPSASLQRDAKRGVFPLRRRQRAKLRQDVFIFAQLNRNPEMYLSMYFICNIVKQSAAMVVTDSEGIRRPPVDLYYSLV